MTAAEGADNDQTLQDVLAEVGLDVPAGADDDVSAAATAAATAAAVGAATTAAATATADGRRFQHLPSEDHWSKLEAIGFTFKVRGKKGDEQWDAMFQQVVEYKERTGDCLVPSRYALNPQLAKWVEGQRYEHTLLQRAKEEEAQAAKGSSKHINDDVVHDVTKDGSLAMDKEDIRPVATVDDKKKKRKIFLNEERIRRLDEIGFVWRVKNKMKRFHDRQWDEIYAELVEYKQQHGDCLVPKRYPESPRLGQWVCSQRSQYRKLQSTKSKEDTSADKREMNVDVPLNKERCKKLDDIGFEWNGPSKQRKEPKKRAPRSIGSGSQRDIVWNQAFERLCNFKESFGHANVPVRYEADPKLGGWVDTQRTQYKKYQAKLTELMSEVCDEVEAQSKLNSTTGRLDQERIARLESIGFQWRVRDQWHRQYEALVDFKNERGHTHVPARYNENRKLGSWVTSQRQAYRHFREGRSDDGKLSGLTRERIDMLNAIGFSWVMRTMKDGTAGDPWNERMEELKAYKAEHGTCNVPTRYPQNPALGVWVGTQRTAYRFYQKAKEEGTPIASGYAGMDDERVQKLTELGFTWSIRPNAQNIWRKRIADLQQFKVTHGHANVPATYNENPRLAAWASQTRAQYRLIRLNKPSYLDTEKMHELDQMGFVWDLHCGDDREPLNPAQTHDPSLINMNQENPRLQVAAAAPGIGTSTETEVARSFTHEPEALPGVEPIPVNTTDHQHGVNMAASMAAAGNFVASAGAEEIAANIADMVDRVV